jgi:hypothetical protein
MLSEHQDLLLNAFLSQKSEYQGQQAVLDVVEFLFNHKLEWHGVPYRFSPALLLRVYYYFGCNIQSGINTHVTELVVLDALATLYYVGGTPIINKLHDKLRHIDVSIDTERTFI